MFWLLLQRFSTKQTRKRMYKSKFSCWRCPQCIHWRLLECCLLWFLQAHQMCHLGHSLPGPGPQSVASIYMLCLSTVLPVPLTRPSFPVWIPALRSAPTFALDRACPPIPSHNLPTLLHSWLPDPQNKSVGWGCAQQYLVWLVKEISVTISVFSYVHIQKVRVSFAACTKKGASKAKLYHQAIHYHFYVSDLVLSTDEWEFLPHDFTSCANAILMKDCDVGLWQKQ